MTTSSTPRLQAFLKENGLYITLFLVIWIIACNVALWGIKKGDFILFFSAHRTDTLNYFFRFCTMLGEGYVYLIATILFLWDRYYKSLGIVLNSAMVLATSTALKQYFGHPRPKCYFDNILQRPNLINYVPDVEVIAGWQSSFPSGHTTSGVAFYTLLSFFIPNKVIKILCLVFALLVGISRMYLVQHFLQDVVAGSILGFTVALTVYWFVTYLFGEKLGGNLKSRKA